EVIREALRFMERNEELIYQMNLDRLRTKLAEGERDMEEGRFKGLGREEIRPFFAKVKEQALGDPNKKPGRCSKSGRATLNRSMGEPLTTYFSYQVINPRSTGCQRSSLRLLAYPSRHLIPFPLQAGFGHRLRSA
ncbi:MAG: hypothetical protein ACREV4_11455, partial [Gammaproteobacteria bacterium]